VGFLWYILIFISSQWIPNVANADGLNAFLSQKTFEFHQGEACHKDTSVLGVPRTKKVSCEKLDQEQDFGEISEGIFFDGAAEEYIRRNRCWDQRIASLDESKKSLLAEQVKDILPLASELTAQIKMVQLQRSEFVRKEPASASDHARNEKRSAIISEFDAEESKLSNQLNAFLSSTWFGDNAIAKKVLLSLADKSPAELEKYLSQFDSKTLQKDLLNPVLNSSLREQAKLIETTTEGMALNRKEVPARTKVLVSPEVTLNQRTKISPLAKLEQEKIAAQKKLDISKLHFDLSDEQKIQLFRENGLGDYLLKRTPTEFKHYANLYCQLDARYGQGRESYEKIRMGIEVTGSLLLPMAPYAAAAKGLISLRAATLISTLGSGGAGTYNLYKSLAKQCGDEGVKFNVSATCDVSDDSKESFTKELSQENCYAGLALAAVQFTMPLALNSLKKLKAVRPSEDVLVNVASVAPVAQVEEVVKVPFKANSGFSDLDKAVRKAEDSGYTVTRLHANEHRIDLADVKKSASSRNINAQVKDLRGTQQYLLDKAKEIEGQIVGSEKELREVQDQMKRFQTGSVPQSLKDRESALIQEIAQLGLEKEKNLLTANWLETEIDNPMTWTAENRIRRTTSALEKREYGLSSPKIDTMKKEDKVSQVKLVEKETSEVGIFQPSDKSVTLYSPNVKAKNITNIITHEVTHAKGEAKVGPIRRNSSKKLRSYPFSFWVRATKETVKKDNLEGYDVRQYGDEVAAFRAEAYEALKQGQKDEAISMLGESNKAVDRNLQALDGALKSIEGITKKEFYKKHAFQPNDFGDPLGLKIPVRNQHGEITHNLEFNIKMMQDIGALNRPSVDDFVEYLNFLKKAQLTMQKANNKNLKALGATP
jgi:hypothetical protein